MSSDSTVILMAVFSVTFVMLGLFSFFVLIMIVVFVTLQFITYTTSIDDTVFNTFKYLDF
jgi:uncharacterized membrane protein YqjE